MLSTHLSTGNKNTILLSSYHPSSYNLKVAMSYNRFQSLISVCCDVSVLQEMSLKLLAVKCSHTLRESTFTDSYNGKIFDTFTKSLNTYMSFSQLTCKLTLSFVMSHIGEFFRKETRLTG